LKLDVDRRCLTIGEYCAGRNEPVAEASFRQHCPAKDKQIDLARCAGVLLRRETRVSDTRYLVSGESAVHLLRVCCSIQSSYARANLANVVDETEMGPRPR